MNVWMNDVLLQMLIGAAALGAVGYPVYKMVTGAWPQVTAFFWLLALVGVLLGGSYLVGGVIENQVHDWRHRDDEPAPSCVGNSPYCHLPGELPAA